MSKIEELIKETYNLAQSIAGLKTKHDTNKLVIQEYFDKQELKILEVSSKDETVSPTIVAKKMEQVRIDYFVEKLKEKLDKEVFNEIVNKTYTIKNIEAMKAMLKEAGVKPQEFKDLIEVSEVLNKDQLKQLYAVGDITKNDLKGCFEARIIKSIKIEAKKGGKD